MASKIRNVVETTFTSKGAARVEKETQSIGRAQTRLGQESASASRQFAAQSTGLGGVVAAYAGAAATVFALSSAFEALARSARAAQTINALNVLAAETGASGRELSSSIQEVIRGQLTLLQITEKLNISLSAGFNTEQIEGLAEVALLSSRALGRDLNDSFNRVVKGAAELNTGVLKQLGIFVRVDTAVSAYATAIGKSASELSEYERRQALVNAVIEQGRTKFSGINTTIPTTLEQIDRFTVKVRDLAIQFGTLIADALAPLAAVLTNSVGGAFAAVGLAISLIAGKGIDVLTTGANALTATITNTGIATEQFVRRLTGTGEAAQKASSAIADLDTSILKINRRQKEQILAIQKTTATRSLSSVEIRNGISILKASQKALLDERQALISNNAAVVDRFRTTQVAFRAAQTAERAARAQPAGAFGTREFAKRTQAIRAASREVENQRVELEKLRPAVRQYTTDIRANSAALTQNQNTIVTLNASLKGFAAGFSNVAVSVATATASFVAGFTGLATSILSIGSRIFFFVNLITLVGTAIAGALGRAREFDAVVSNIGNAIKTLFTSQTSRNVKEVLQGVSAISLENLEKIDPTLKDIDDFTFKTKFVGVEIEITKSKQDLIDEVNSILAATSAATERSLVDSVGTETAIGAIIGNVAVGALRFAGPAGTVIATAAGRQIGTAIGAGIGTIWSYLKADEEIPAEVKNNIKKEFASAFVGIEGSIQDRLATAIFKVRENLEDAARIDPRARAALRFQEQLILESAKYLENIEAVSDIFAATALPIDTIVRNFRFEGAKEDANKVLRALTEIQGFKFEFEFITDAQREALREASSSLLVDTKPFEDLFPPKLKEALQRFNQSAKQEGRNLDETIRALFTERGALDLNLVEDADAKKVLGGFISQLRTLPSILDGTSDATENAATAYRILFSGLVDLQKPFLDLADAVNRYQQSALRTVEVGRALSEGFATGTIDIEAFTQGFGNFSNSLILSERSLETVNERIAAVSSALTDTRIPDTTRKELNEQLVTLIKIRDNTIGQLQTARQLFEVLKAQGEQLAKQVQLTKFLESFIVKDFDPIKIGFDLQLAGLSEAEKFTRTIELLKKEITAEPANFNTLNEVRKQLEALNLTTAETQLILSSTEDDLANLAKSLGREGLTAVVKGAAIEIETLGEGGAKIKKTFDETQLSAAQLANQSEKAVAAIQGFVEQNIQRLPQLVDAALNNFKKLVEDIDKELAKLAQQEYDIKFKARLDEEDFVNQINLLKSRFELDRLQLQVDLVAAQVSVGRISAGEGAQQENRLQQQILAERRRLIGLEYQQQLDAIFRKTEQASLEYTRSLEVISQETEAQKARVSQEAQFIKNIIEAYNEIRKADGSQQQSFLTGLSQVGQAIADVVINAFNAGARVINASIRAGFKDAEAFELAPIQVIAPSTDLPKAIEVSSADIDTQLNTTLEKIAALERRRRELADQTFRAVQDAALREIQVVTQTKNNKIELLEIEGQIEELNAQKRLQTSGKTSDKLSKDAERLKQILTSIFEGINSAIETSLIGVKNFILFGEGNLEDVFVQLLRSIGDTILEEGFIKPLSERLAEGFFGRLTGIQGGRSGIEEAFKRDGSPAKPFVVTSADGPLGGLLSPQPEGDQAAGIGGFFQNIMGFIKNTFTTLFGADGFLTNLISGFGNIVGNVFTGILRFITGIFGFGKAAGGMIHRAGGGAIPQLASGGGLRDRVPALLEPGEFVLRRAAANKIGISNLQQMNATGQTPGGAPIINITNEGTAKTAETSQPRFDGERYVIDIVTRDLQNNGPIRRSLRGGL